MNNISTTPERGKGNSLINSDALDWGIGEMNKELADLRYGMNEFLDFQEWLIDIHLNDGTTASELWDKFNQHRDALISNTNE